MTIDDDQESPTPNAHLTEPGARFWEQFGRDVKVIIAPLEIGDRYKEVLEAANHLKGRPGNRLKSTLAELVEETRRSYLRIGHTLFESGLTRAIDNYLCYLSEIIREVIRVCPQTLSSGSTVTMKDVLRHDTIAGLVEWWADSQVNKLSYGGLDKIHEFFDKRLGIKKLAPNDDVHDGIKCGVAARNILVHNRGIIDERAVNVLGDRFGSKGERIQILLSFINVVGPAVCSSVNYIDKELSKKYSIPVFSYSGYRG
jgi:hypothetical protein